MEKYHKLSLYLLRVKAEFGDLFLQNVEFESEYPDFELKYPDF